MWLPDCRSGRLCVGGIAKWKWKEVEAGVVWKWELHTGDEVGAMRRDTGMVEWEGQQGGISGGV